MTPRQAQVLEEVRQGKSNKEIARALNISEATVKLHLTSVFIHLGVRTRWQAIARTQTDALKVAREALEFYAGGIGHTEIEDGGKRARDALERSK